MNDNEIIALYFGRDENAINQTAIKYGSKLSGLSYKILKSSEDSEECVNDTYLKAWNTMPPQKPAFLFAYLAKICRFLCFGRIDYYKAQKRKAQFVALSDELLQCIPSNLTETIPSEQALKGALESFLKGLSEEKRLIFMRRYWFFDSISEIATSLHISESKVKSTLFRTREKLKNYLKKEGVNI
ncbi:MAG: RNA polymerase sigma factor [Oscillospiraceae bacterium]